jgi:hypothetical protein
MQFQHTTSDYLRLDVRRLQQEGLLDKCMSFGWQWTRSDEPYANEALERFVRKEPLRRTHECVFGVLALESEPVDPRL